MIETLLSPEELLAVRKEIPATPGRAKTLRLLMKLGFTKRKARSLIEGSDAPLQPLPRREPKQWSRELILAQFNSLT